MYMFTGVGNCQLFGASVACSHNKFVLYGIYHILLNLIKMTRCCVPHCSEIGRHKFPKDMKMRKLWLKVIHRENFVPKDSSRLCQHHFGEKDYEMTSKYTGLENQHKYLKKGTIPSIFPWNQKALSDQAKAREERLGW